MWWFIGISFLIFCINLSYNKGLKKGAEKHSPAFDSNLVIKHDIASISQYLSTYTDNDHVEFKHQQSSSPNLEQLDYVQGLIYEIKYEDAEGDTTTRTISIKNASSIILAYCYMRRAPRHFRLDRISSATCMATGEVFESPLSFYEHLKQENNAIQTHLDGTTDILTVLVAIARADRRFLDCEKQIIFEHLQQNRNFPDDHKDWLFTYLDSIRPSPESFLTAVENTTRNQQITSIADLAQKIAEADGKVTAKEVEIISSIQAA
jgi:uncharacterized tellurite resistance protein B-like protein